MTSGSLAYLMGCGVASNDKYQVGYLEHGVVPTKAAGDAQSVIWDGADFGHSNQNIV